MKPYLFALTRLQTASNLAHSSGQPTAQTVATAQ
jgi:hypothetical protein